MCVLVYFRVLYWGRVQLSRHSPHKQGVCWIITPDIHPHHGALGQWLPRLLTPANLCLDLSLFIQHRLLSSVAYGSSNANPLPTTGTRIPEHSFRGQYRDHSSLLRLESWLFLHCKDNGVRCRTHKHNTMHSCAKTPTGSQRRSQGKATSGKMSVDVRLNLEAGLQISLKLCSNLWEDKIIGLSVKGRGCAMLREIIVYIGTCREQQILF